MDGQVRECAQRWILSPLWQLLSGVSGSKTSGCLKKKTNRKKLGHSGAASQGVTLLVASSTPALRLRGRGGRGLRRCCPLAAAGGRCRGAGGARRLHGAAMSGAALGKAAAAAARPRRKVLSAEEAELFELAQAAGSGLDPEVFK